MMMISAVLDACILYPAPLRDFLLRLAEDKLFFPLWTEKIRDEWIDNLLRRRPDLKRENLERTRRQMDFHFPDSLVHGYEPITPTLTLPDPNDCHVLAAAVHAKTKYIVTFDLNHFPNAILQPCNIEALSPDEFVLRLIQQYPKRVLATAQFHRLRLTRPPKTVDEYLTTLEKQGLSDTVAFLREHKDAV